MSGKNRRSESDPELAFERSVRVLNRRIRTFLMDWDPTQPIPDEIMSICRIIASWKKKSDNGESRGMSEVKDLISRVA